MNKPVPSVSTQPAARKNPPRLRAVALAVGAAFGLPQAAYALPTGGTVVSGSSAITQTNATTLSITQTTTRSAVNWLGFNTAAGESVVVKQPAGGTALYRVSSPVEFYGRLSANGQIFLSSPTGVYFAPGASVDVGGLVATTLSMSQADFNAGRNVFTNVGATGSVINNGSISAPNGYVALLGPQVANNGLIAARMGAVALAAGDKITLDMVGDGLIKVTVDQAALSAAAMNKGTIEADGGTVLITAKSANALLDTVINTEGVIRANSIGNRNGTITLDGGDKGVTSVSGQLEAKGIDPHTIGGNIRVLGNTVTLLDGARINASGDAGGGTVLIGGDFQGKNPDIRNAIFTTVAPDAYINADALTTGNGGKIIVWSDDTTKFFGYLSARGGADAGDGGFAEVSGKHGLLIPRLAGHFDLASPKGRGGELLLDPNTIEIVTAGSACTSSAPTTCTVTAGGTLTVAPSDIESVLAAGTNVTLKTNDLAGATDDNIIVTNAPNTSLATASAKLKLDADDFVVGFGNFNATTGANVEVILKVALTGTAVKTYDGSTSATLNSGNYSVKGIIQGDTVTITQTTGTYSAGADVASNPTGSTVSATLTGSDYTAGNSVYTLPGAATGAIGEITKRQLTVALTGTAVKTYDGSTSATLASSNYSVTNTVGTESFTVTQTTGTYSAGANVASNPTGSTVSASLVTGDYSAGGGATIGNYTIATPATGAIGEITKRQLTVALTGTAVKTYDGSTSATLASSNYSVTNTVGTESFTVTQTTGTYSAGANVASNPTGSTVSASLVTGDYSAGGGATIGNYTIATPATGAIGEITKRQLTVALTGTAVKTYDGSTSATLASSNYSVTNTVGTESFTVTQTSGTYSAGANVASNPTGSTVSASLVTGDYSAGGGATIGNYTIATPATGAIGEITKRQLTVALTGTAVKTYDGSTSATLASSNYSVTNTVGTESFTVTQTTGTYSAGANVASNPTGSTVSASLVTGDYSAGGGATIGNYTIATPATGAIGEITKRQLTVALTGTAVKTYDGSTSATLASSNYSVTNTVGTESFTVTQTSGTYSAGANVASNPTGSTVSASLVTGDYSAGGGATIGNYTIATPATGAIGEITKRQLTVALTGTAVKTYDGSTSATLASSNYSVTNTVGTESFTVTQTSGTYSAGANVASNPTGSTVSASLVTGDYSAGGGATIGNYTIATPATGAIGEITKRQLTVALTGTAVKTYDGSTSATLASSNYSVTNTVGTESFTVTQTSGTYSAGANVASNPTGSTVSASLVTGDYSAGGGATIGNYTIATPATGAIGEITKRQLTVALTGTAVKTYDGSTSATLASSNYSVTNTVGTESFTVTQTSGTYSAGANVASNPTGSTVSASLVTGDYSAGGGATIGNYTIATPATGAIGEITKRQLTVALTGTAVKTYDGSTSATLASSNYSVTNTVGTESFTVTQTSGTYSAGANVASNPTGSTVSASLVTGDYSAGGGATIGNYTIATPATGAIGEITKRQLTVALTGTAVKTYDGSTSATLASSNYSVTNTVGTESFTVTQTTGTYSAGANVASNPTGSTVSASLVTGDYSAGGGATIGNYTIATPATGAIGEITKRQLTVALTGTAVKTYDGSTSATLASSNYSVTNTVGTESFTVTQTTGTYSAGANVASNPTGSTVSASLVTGDYSAGGGATIGNYTIATPATGAIGEITKRQLTVALTGTAVKTYDGSTSATLASSNYSVTNTVGTESFTVTQTTGTYSAGANVASNPTGSTVSASLVTGDYSAGGGATIGNYTIATPATGAIGEITKRQLTVALTGTAVKTYDGSTSATLASSNYSVTNTVGTESFTVTQTTGTYSAGANVASNPTGSTVSASLVTGDYSAGGGATIGNYTIATPATGAIGEITKRQLTVALTGTAVKTYDGSTSATLASSNYSVTNTVGTESFTVTQTTGTYSAGANVASNPTGSTVSASLVTGDYSAGGGATIGNYTIATPATGAIGEITKRQLTVALTGTAVKTYDGSTSATLASSNYSVTNTVGTESFTVTQTTGTYSAGANVASNPTGSTVSASLVTGDYSAGGGALIGNYTIATPATGAIGEITKRQLTVALTGTAVKTYDGSTSATLASSNYSVTNTVGTESFTITKTTGTYDNGKDVVNNPAGSPVSTTVIAGDYSAGGGALIGNYTIATPVPGAIGQITTLSSVTYTGPATGNWSAAGNWTSDVGSFPVGAIPDSSQNVQTVNIPTAKTVVFDMASTVNVDAVSGAGTGKLTFNGAGTLAVAGTVNMPGYSHSAGTLSAQTVTVSNNFNQTGGQINAGSGGANITHSGSTLTLGNLTTTAAGPLVVNSTNQAIVQTVGSVLDIAGTAQITAGANVITLDNVGNNFRNTVTLSNSGTNDVTIRDSDNISFASMTLGRHFTVNAGGTIALSNTTTTGNQQYNSNVTLASTETTGGGTFNVTGTTTLLSSLSTINTGGGNVGLSGAVATDPGEKLIINAGAGTITMNNTGNTMAGPLELAGGNTLVANTGTLNLGTSNIVGTLGITTSGGGSITQSGPLIVSGTSNLQAGTGAITLTNTANDFQSGVTAAGTGVSFTDANSFLGTSINSGTGVMNLTANALLGPSVLTGTTGQLSSGTNVVGANVFVTFSGQLVFAGAATIWNLQGGSTANPFALLETDLGRIGVSVGGAAVTVSKATITQTLATSAAQASATAAAADEAAKTFGTDSVAEQVEYGFAGDVGTLPPMDHRLQGVGIAVPKCFNQSREGESC